MRLLLDTHILLWWLADDSALREADRAAIRDPASAVFVSAATAWEIAIKCALGKLAFPTGELPQLLVAEGFEPLGIELRHAIAAGALPPHHHDPFDRMLVAQAQIEGLTIMTIDPMIRRYAIAVYGLAPE